jgi:hypothetical protein
MKKVKIMLMSIAVLAVVGGALAFKAKKFSVAYCHGTTSTLLTSEVIPATTTTTDPLIASTWVRSTDASGGAINDISECEGLTTETSFGLKIEE